MESPITILPPEILALIFQHACQPTDIAQKHDAGLPVAQNHVKNQRYPQFVMAAVSTHWRQVVFDTPYLWTSLNLDVTYRTFEYGCEIFQAFLTYSRSLFITISLRFLDDFSVGPNMTLLVESLHNHAHRVQEFDLVGRVKPWVDYIPRLSHLSRLSLKETFPMDTPDVLIFDTIPCSHITLSNLQSHVQLSWSRITVLHLNNLPCDVSLELLEKCVNLVDYRNRNTGGEHFESEPDQVTLSSPFTLQRLEVFGWSVDDGHRVDTALLRHIRMPTLKTLIWDELLEPGFLTLDHTRTFFYHLPSTLSALHIERAYTRSASLLDIIPNHVNIKHLTLRKCSDHFLSDVFRRLTPALNDDGSWQKPEMPKLKSVVIEAWHNESHCCMDPMWMFYLWKQRRGVTERAFEMFEKRFLQANFPCPEPFRLEFKAAVIWWSSQLKEQLKDMVGRGLNVELIEDSKRIDCP